MIQRPNRQRNGHTFLVLDRGYIHVLVAHNLKDHAELTFL